MFTTWHTPMRSTSAAFRGRLVVPVCLEANGFDAPPIQLPLGVSEAAMWLAKTGPQAEYS